jgi:hypothetical protein
LPSAVGAAENCQKLPSLLAHPKSEDAFAKEFT